MTQISRTGRSRLPTMALMAATFLAGPAVSQQSLPTAQNDLIGPITRCRAVEADGPRLACFDAAAATLAAAGEVAVVSRRDVEQNQRRLFGFNVSALNPFENSGAENNLQSISATLTSARNLGRGEWLITLDDGSVWHKTDSVDVLFSARRQYPVTVRRAALGSYMMKVGDTPPFRVKRE